MTPSTTWNCVSRETPCPICGRFDWCLLSADESACICPRTESAKRAGEAGYLHVLADAPARRRDEARVLRVPARTTPPDLGPLATEYQHAATAGRVQTFASSIGVKTMSLIAFGLGWSAGHSAWSFPMTDPQTRRVTRIRLRRDDGAKFSVKGGKEALFLPGTPTADDEVLLVLEGASDAIAAHGVGFPNAIGRPSCSGGTRHLVALVRRLKPPAVIVVADADEPGRRGADALAATLALYSTGVKVVVPPTGHKDMRAWVATGATRPDVENLIRRAAAVRLSITLTTKGGRQ